jgi:uncharacterized protein (DUF697 family)
MPAMSVPSTFDAGEPGKGEGTDMSDTDEPVPRQGMMGAGGVLDRLWKGVADELFGKDAGSGANDKAAQERARRTAPVIWLLGKTGSGKTSVVAALTGDSRAEVGAGFEPCTRTAAFYDFPHEAPLVRFLDTRGLEEAGYDASDDVAWCEGQAHIVLAVTHLSDPDQAAVLDVLRAVRRRHPDWPVVVAQTHVHALYQRGEGHPAVYPFTGGAEDETSPVIPHPLRQAIAHQRRIFAGLPGAAPRFVPVDLTQPEDGYTPEDYGIDALLAAIGQAGPEAQEALQEAARRDEAHRIRARCRPIILGHAVAAVGAGAAPLPLVGAGGLAAILGSMLRYLARRHGVAWTPAMFAEFTGAIGGGALLWWGARYGLRELLKLIPFAGTWLGGALNATAAFSVAYGLGEAACVWLGYRQRGRCAPDEEVRRAFAEGLAEGLRRGKRRDGRQPGAAA